MYYLRQHSHSSDSVELPSELTNGVLITTSSEATGFIQWIQNTTWLSCEEQGNHWECQSCFSFP